MASIDAYEQALELELLGEDDTGTNPGEGAGPDHSVKNAPIITGDAYAAMGRDVFPQRALYGRILEQEVRGFPSKSASPQLYINTNAPFSAIVCGVQGSGKSHSTSVLLESCLIHDTRLGSLPAPLSGVLFHFDTAAGGGLPQPCEAAYLASLDPRRGGHAKPPQVTVLVLPSTLATMRIAYAALPNVKVMPLHFAPEDISGQRLLAMMKVETELKMPLYMECLMTILRGMDPFNYRRFRKELDAQPFDSTQKAMLNLRLTLLDSCLDGGNATNKVSTHFKPGQLTIIDLSSPFMDASSACGFFDLVLGLFIETKLNQCAKLIVLDEAHKYLSDNGSSSRLTDSLLSVIRQQRHFGARVLISTQEPTVVPSKFLDLCSFVIAHRFSSPQWLKHLAHHIPAIDGSEGEWFSKVLSLRTGQAMLFAPAGLGIRHTSGLGEANNATQAELSPLGQGYLLVRSRLRITQDGGQSLMAVTADSDGLSASEQPSRSISDVSTLDAPSSSFVSLPPAYTEEIDPSRVSSTLDRTRSAATADSVSKATTTAPVLSPFEQEANTTLPTPNASPAPSAHTVISTSSYTPLASSAHTKSFKILQRKFQPLVKFLEQRHAQGAVTIAAAEVNSLLLSLKNRPHKSQSLNDYLIEASKLHLIHTKSGKTNASIKTVRTTAYAPLINSLLFYRALGYNSTDRNSLAEALETHFPSVLGAGGSEAYFTEAAAAGLVDLGDECIVLRDPDILRAVDELLT